jgi:excisionase family DNA binding protein
MSESLMTVEEVAQFLRVTKSTVTKLAKRGDLPGKKVGYLWRFDRAAIQNWIGVSSPSEKTQ